MTVFNKISAIFKSEGVVILIFSLFPSVKFIVSPILSTTEASSVKLLL